MIETVRELARALSAERVSVDELLGQLGGQGTEIGDSVVVDAPALDGVERAGVVRHAGGGEPALVTLHLSRPQPREELEQAFGAPRAIHPDHLGEPVTLLFDVGVPAGPYDVALLATDDVGGPRTLTLRRDIRLG